MKIFIKNQRIWRTLWHMQSEIQCWKFCYLPPFDFSTLASLHNSLDTKSGSDNICFDSFQMSVMQKESFIKYIPYAHHLLITNHSWILTIHKDRTLKKTSLKTMKSSSKVGWKNINRVAGLLKRSKLDGILSKHEFPQE